MKKQCECFSSVNGLDDYPYNILPATNKRANPHRLHQCTLGPDGRCSCGPNCQCGSLKIYVNACIYIYFCRTVQTVFVVVIH